MKWGTKSPVLIPSQTLPGGMPIRAFGTFTCKVSDYDILLEKIAGVRDQFTVDDVRERIISMLDQLLMKWIVREGQNMFNLQLNADAIAHGIMEDLDMEMTKIGISITSFVISNFNYPEEVQKMAEKAAAQSMIPDVDRYQQVAMGTAIENGTGGSAASDMAGMAMGMAMGQQMAAQMNSQNPSQLTGNQIPSSSGQKIPNFCPNCGAKTNGGNFCSNCGQKLI